MANPYLPKWEYIPDGEPRVFGDRVYIYGSHDHAASDSFCDYCLKVWSAPVNDPEQWICHGEVFRTTDAPYHPADTDWTDGPLYAPDVVEKDGKYYLYAYIFGGKGCIAAADRPEGPFRLLSQYEYGISDEVCCNGWFIDQGVLVDDDGRVYAACGFERSFMIELEENMYCTKDDTLIEHIIPADDEFGFFEGCSLRKIGKTYYFIYSGRPGSQLRYATSDSPMGPYTYRGVIIDNGELYPGGNNHGSICCINGQWYIFYHRMTNGTIMSRRGCAERIEILEDGTIPQVEMTSLGFAESLNPYEITPAEIACVLVGGCIVTERNIFSRTVTNITEDCVIGYKYFDFGEDESGTPLKLHMQTRGNGSNSAVSVYLDDWKEGEPAAVCNVGTGDGIYTAELPPITGRHAVYFVAKDSAGGWFRDEFKGRHLFELEQFVFTK
ncbi:MAG: family 43 glycosylhydrolase [Ruminococcus sp.]|nr:family 43 glycosylhydrolase [Ruminococcus sp.]